MTVDEAIAIIPDGWRFYTCDASVVGRYSVMLRQVAHIGYVNGIGPTLQDAIETAAIGAKWHYRGWTIEPAYMGYYATHPDFDAEQNSEGDWIGNGLQAHAMTLDGIKAEVDAYIEENGYA